MLFRVGLVLAFALPQSVIAQNTVSPLAGLTVVEVVVETLPPGVQETGLLGDQVRTDVELALRQSGLRVLNDAPAYLYININMTSYSPQEVHAYAVSVELYRPVTLVSRSRVALVAAVWSARGSIGMAPVERAAQRARESVTDQVNQFLNEWLAANPRR